jgi:hypothetical protein
MSSVQRLVHKRARLSERVVDLGIAAISGWTKWFWRLDPAPKFLALGAHVVAAYLAVTWLRLGTSGLTLVKLGALGLAFFALASLLFGSTRRKDER